MSSPDSIMSKVAQSALVWKQSRKPLKWVGFAKRDPDAMPDDVEDLFGHAIDLAQAGGKHQDAEVLTGFGSAGVLEVVEVMTEPA